MARADVMLKLWGTAKNPGAEDLYSNNATDMGKETILGISRAKHPEAKVWPEVDRLKASGTPLPQWWDDKPLLAAADAFYADLWKEHQLDYVPEALQGPIFGGIVNQGVQVVIDLQECLQKMHQMVTVDGEMGPGTLSAIAKVEGPILADLLAWRRTKGYEAIVQKHPDQHVNFHGWICRLLLGL